MCSLNRVSQRNTGMDCSAYPVTLVSDGHSTVSNSVLFAAQITAHHNEILANITSFGPRVNVVPASEVQIEA